MAINNRASTGLKGFDEVIDMLRLEDNVVWQVESVDDFRKVVNPYIKQAVSDNRRLIYIRFGSYAPLVSEEDASIIYELDASKGFESFAMEIHNIIKDEGLYAFYVFDCLTDLLQFWYSDLMIGNFFRVTCPFLFQLKTVAYFSLIRKSHTYDTIARIRETTQLLLDLYTINDETYIHPLKVWERYSPTMFFPHLIKDDEAVCITSSAEAAGLFSRLQWTKSIKGYWDSTLDFARSSLSESHEIQEKKKQLLIDLMFGKDSQILPLCQKYFTLEDLLSIAEREIGTGRIGGKSVGMLLARQILKTNLKDLLENRWESHDSYYLGADVFYTYIVQNDLWQLRAKQKTVDGYFKYAPELKEKLLLGEFPKTVRDQFMLILEYFGQSPIIVRSSSLLEDNYGNAFAGKYDSIFLANQGTPEDRFEAFEQAIRLVYASTMNQDALSYRANRGLLEKDEQMSILIQRVSGDHYQDFFFPHIAGVGNSTNLYVWDKSMDPDAGMIRLVLGLGTRAVDRVSQDYARIVALSDPDKLPPTNYGDEKRFSQHKIDCINLRDNCLDSIEVDHVSGFNLKTNKQLFYTADYAEARRLNELGYHRPTPQNLDFKRLLDSDFPVIMKRILETLKAAYQYPVDIEFAGNFTKDGELKINILQCRPLQTKGLGKPVSIPVPPEDQIVFETNSNFMGGNMYLPIDYVIFVKGEEYNQLSPQKKYQTARYIGELNQHLKDSQTLLMGPGRWGTTTPALGVPVHFTELCNMSVLCEVAYEESGMMPDLSFGSHFFQDIVESNIFYSAVFTGAKDVSFNPDKILSQPNILNDLIHTEPLYQSVIHVIKPQKMELYSDVTSQKLLCFES